MKCGYAYDYYGECCNPAGGLFQFSDKIHKTKLHHQVQNRNKIYSNFCHMEAHCVIIIFTQKNDSHNINSNKEILAPVLESNRFEGKYATNKSRAH